MASEKRLIDANDVVAYLQRTKIDNVLPNWQDLSPTTKCAVLKIVMALRATILRAKTVDAVEVVRCKDCKQCEYIVYDYGRCRKTMLLIKNDDFCSYGERREGE